MKNLITILASLTLLTNTMLATTTPEILWEDASIEVSTIEEVAIFESATFNDQSENLEFTTRTDISLIQIFNHEGKLEFQLPVMSNDVKINKNLFGEGTFKLGFMLEGQNEMVFTQVTVK